jgi:hypothetical protein
MPSWLEVTTYIDCPNRCSYCPQETLLKAYKGPKVMSLDDFRIILRNTPKEVDIHFSGFSELFFNPNAVDYLLEAFKEHQVVVYTTTKGMSDIVYEQIKNLPFKEFHVHDRGARPIPFKTDSIVINDSNKISRGGNLWDRPEKYTGTCIKSPDYTGNVVLPNGDVYLCCMDYGLTTKIGNLLEQDFYSLKRPKTPYLCTKCEWYE